MHLYTKFIATEITQTGYSTKNVQIDQLFFASWGMHVRIHFASLGFLCIRDVGRRGNKTTALLKLMPVLFLGQTQSQPFSTVIMTVLKATLS